MLHNFITILNAILPLVIMVFLGYMLKELKIISAKAFDEINNFSYKIGLPINLYISIVRTNIFKTFNLKYFIVSNVVLLACYFIQAPLVKKICQRKDQVGPLLVCTYRANCLALASPLLNNIYGASAVGIMALLVAFITPSSNILAVLIYEKNSGKKTDFKGLLLSVLKNPFIIALVLAFFTNLLNITFPVFLDTSLNYINQMASPLCLIGIGGTFVFSSLKKNKNLLVWASLFKLVFAPIICTILCLAFGLRNDVLLCIYLIVSGPIATSSYAMAKNMYGDAELASQIILVTTCASAFIIFAWMMLYATFGLIVL